MKEKKKRSGIKNPIMEMNIFLYSLSFILIYIFYPGFQKDLALFEVENLILPIYIGAGIFFSVFNILSKRKKTKFEVSFLIHYSLLINVMAIYSMFRYTVHQNNYLIFIFPIINLVLSYFIISWRLSISGPEIRKLQNNLLDVAIGTIPLIIIFVFCYFPLRLNEAITLSLCVSYSTVSYQFVCVIRKWGDKNKLWKI